MKHIFGFCEDYDKVIYEFQHQLTFIRKIDNDSIDRNGATDAGKVRLDKISWFMPHVMPTDEFKIPLYKTIENKSKFPICFRMRRCTSTHVPEITEFEWKLGVRSSPEVPRFIIVAFQTNKNNNQEKNPAIFDHLDVNNIYVTLNSIKYPSIDYKIRFQKQQFISIYDEAVSFREKFSNIDESLCNPNFTMFDFKDLYPIFVFDVSKQSKKLKTSTSDIYINALFNQNVPARTKAYAILISDRTLFIQSDGTEMSGVQ